MTEQEQQEAKEAARELAAIQLTFWMRFRKLDRYQLAEESGISQDAIYKIGRGDRGANLDSLALLAAALGISIPMFWMQVK